MLLTRFIIISILFFNILYNNPLDKSIFISPVKIPLLLSANFGELRIDHFHSGLDIKTQGVSGKEVVAAANGYIYRISVSPGGFGKALYVRHPSGYSTVYGHLDKFTPEIERYVTSQQYEKKSYLITLFPVKEKFPVKQGDLIAYSGNSGSSAGPHLHYEIRKSDSEIPVNPLLFDFGTADNIEPVIEKLVIYPINRHTLINNQHNIIKINVSGGHGNYYIPAETEIRISGSAGFGIKSFDLLNDSYNKCAVYSIELSMDSIPVFKYVMDGFSFNESRFINSHIDYETYMKENIYIERTFVLPYDKLSVYKYVLNRGILNFDDDKLHFAEITVTDINNNKSTLTFTVKAQPAQPQDVAETVDKDLKLMPFGRSNKFVSENISISIPAGALYDTLYFSYKKSAGTTEMFSDLHHVHDKFTPVHKAYTLSIKPDIIPAGKESKMLIVQLGDDQKKSAMNSIWYEGYLTAEVLSFGNFYIGIDSVSPVIYPNGLVSGANLTGKKEIEIKIADEFSGIKSYEPTIDGKWALFEYDQKNDLLIYRFDEQRIPQGTKHSLSLKVTDNKDNESFYNCDFTW
ncbi:MAG: M23 family metallopeptidase [Bacteroidia bacterium]|nr:M23 family metallopeptidase [Bacteroidia bacterium]